MRKILVLVLLAAFILPTFAEDAKVLPTGVLRITEANVFGLNPGYYDKDGKYTAYKEKEGFIKFFNIGIALELGVNDWITAAVQWTPGWTLWSAIDGTTDKGNISGLYDLFVGAKMQIIGAKAPVQQSNMRLSVAPGIKIPIAIVDYDKQLTELLAGNNYTAIELEKHAFAFGGRLYFDYIFNDMFFLNAYNETLFFLPVEKINSVGTTKKKYEYGYALTFEIEPQISLPLGQGLTFMAGLPFNIAYTPRPKIADSESKTSTTMLYLGPNVSFMMTSLLPMPIEVEIGYKIPVYGMADPDGAGAANVSRAFHAIQLLIKPYLKLF